MALMCVPFWGIVKPIKVTFIHTRPTFNQVQICIKIHRMRYKQKRSASPNEQWILKIYDHEFKLRIYVGCAAICKSSAIIWKSVFCFLESAVESDTGRSRKFLIGSGDCRNNNLGRLSQQKTMSVRVHENKAAAVREIASSTSEAK